MELLRAKKVKITKPHKCFGCRREFPKGTEMQFEVWTDADSVNNSYLCETCQEVSSRPALEWGPGFEFGEGDLREDAIEFERNEA